MRMGDPGNRRPTRVLGGVLFAAMLWACGAGADCGFSLDQSCYVMSYDWCFVGVWDHSMAAWTRSRWDRDSDYGAWSFQFQLKADTWLSVYMYDAKTGQWESVVHLYKTDM